MDPCQVDTPRFSVAYIGDFNFRGLLGMKYNHQIQIPGLGDYFQRPSFE